MKPIDKLLQYLNPDVKNIAEFLDEDQLKTIANNVITGYKIDEDSRSEWLEINKKATEMINGKELINGTEKDFPIPNACKVIYPLIQNSVIQLASQLIMHLVRNDKVADCAVLGKDEQRVIPNPNFKKDNLMSLNQGNSQQMPQGIPTQGQQNTPYTLEWRKAAKAKRVSDFLNYELLIESDSWLEDEHRLNHIVASWGVGFKECYYDYSTKRNCSDIIPPEDVIINNNNYGSLEKARRITVRQYLSKNDIIEKIRAGQFLDVDWDLLESNKMDNQDRVNNSQEINPVIECFKQFCYIDLDEDDYEEPYYVYVTHDSRQVLGIYPAFKFKDVQIDKESGSILAISPHLTLVDRHLISSTDGKYYSKGVNHLLFHQNKSITSILRQLVDAGTLSNASASTGFVTKSLKNRERVIRISLGQYMPVDLPQGARISDQIMNLPVREPSQVLLALLQLLIESGKESGFISDLLTGQTEMQNVPATTVLATIEQGTRAFKPVVQKMFRSLKKEFKLWFDNYAMYLDEDRYIKFQDESFVVTKDDFDDSLDIVPVADPTMSSEAHKFARLNALVQMMQNVPGSTNIQEGALRYFTDLQFENPEALVGIPPQTPPDPKMAQVQLKARNQPIENRIEALKLQTHAQKLNLEQQKLNIKYGDSQVKAHQANVKTAKTVVDAHKEAVDMSNEQNLTAIEAFNASTERKRVELLGRQHGEQDDFRNDQE